MSRPARTADAGKEMARGLGLSEEMIELCTTGSACHKALKEMVAKREDSETYPKEKFIEDVAKRFAEVVGGLRRITAVGTDIRAITAAAAAPVLRVIEGDGASREVADLLAATSGSVVGAIAAPLATRAARSSSK